MYEKSKVPGPVEGKFMNDHKGLYLHSHYSLNKSFSKVSFIGKNVTLQPYLEIKIQNFLINRPHKLLYCWIHKVASTTFIAMFSALAGRNVRENYYREIKFLVTKTKRELEAILYNETFTKFVIVRHPFDRLVSAYRDRLQDNSHFTTQAWKYVPQILAKRKLRSSDLFDINQGMKLKIIPTFEEFIDWLVAKPASTYDVHWIRYHDHCATDKISYNIILKLEIISQNRKHILSKIGLKNTRIFIKHLQKSMGGVTTFDVSCTYFKQLNLTQAQALYNIYKKDFKLFNYTPDAYYNCAKSIN